ncbi:hypothetical protein [Pendulispora albinea]|uniref:Cytochrome c domain-containing protein n=1 Tax=Pendulispora albinea TaxID=2741071 RepID=A0ABZ2M7T1_9BACT
MQFAHFTKTPRAALLALPLALPLVSACSSAPSKSGEGDARHGDEDVGIAAASLTTEELARAALAALGKVEGRREQCTRCHDVNRTSLRKWAAHYSATMATLRDSSKPAAQRVNQLRRNPNDPGSPFVPDKIGFLAGGAHFGVGPQVNPERHPKTLAQSKLLASLFASEDDYASFREKVRMPIDPTYERLTATEYEAVLTWVEQGMPKLDELVPADGQPTTCVDNFADLKNHARAMLTTGWAAVNRDNHMPMFACAAGSAPLDCFKQQYNGKDIFPDAKTTTYGSTWAAAGTTVRILRTWAFESSFWTRSSADGRFVGTGVSSGGPAGYHAAVSDLAAALDPAGPRTRDIWLNASYDPSFYPDNTGFLFQATPRGLSICGQSLLTDPRTRYVSFREASCSGLGSNSLYQTVGQQIGDNSLGDRFVVNSAWVGDNGGYSVQTDTQPSAGPDAAQEIHVLTGGSVDGSGYRIGQTVRVRTPYEGDTMMSPTSKLLANRVNGNVNGQDMQLGYTIRRVSATMNDTGYSFVLGEAGRICMPGAKANFSYDERFLVTYHYLTRADFASDADYAPYRRSPASDIYLADFVTGEKLRVTRMKPGQFALFPHFRSDGWLYFTVRDVANRKEYVAATDVALRRPPTESP